MTDTNLDKLCYSDFILRATTFRVQNLIELEIVCQIPEFQQAYSI